ncbi:MAG TPA: UDP-glucose/GDP-mannose dehydrogenase family protein [candidate division Zixibacteria bacterium]|nr:UDP-glucose/GDP-mannose dehydrogenase family protein [candidate division Zixibacteria bacterium]
MEICVIGAGYVGLVTAVCVSDFGHNVRCLDIDEERIEALLRGEVPFYEPGLAELMKKNIDKNRFLFTTDVDLAVKGAEVVFIGVGTPMNPEDGTVNLDYVIQAAKDIAPHLSPKAVVVDKSTVPVGTARMVKSILLESGVPESVEVVSNPEFLREGSAVGDFLHPDRVVIGSDRVEAAEILKRAYHPLVENGIDFLVTSPEAAELIKYASNAFLAVKLTFINEIALLADAIGIDALEVAKGIGLDKRIGKKYLRPGPGFGGSCLPKDTHGLLHIANTYDCRMNVVETAIEVNDNIPAILAGRISTALGGLQGKKIGLLGLAFKGNTDDVRYSPAIEIAKELVKGGAMVTAFDPEATKLAKRVLGDSISYANSPEEALTGADAGVIATEWVEFGEIDPSDIREWMAGDLLADFRNIFSPKAIVSAGLRFIGMGRQG